MGLIIMASYSPFAAFLSSYRLATPCVLVKGNILPSKIKIITKNSKLPTNIDDFIVMLSF